jgi:hypothetical protein
VKEEHFQKENREYLAESALRRGAKSNNSFGTKCQNKLKQECHLSTPLPINGALHRGVAPQLLAAKIA